MGQHSPPCDSKRTKFSAALFNSPKHFISQPEAPSILTFFQTLYEVTSMQGPLQSSHCELLFITTKYSVWVKMHSIFLIWYCINERLFTLQQKANWIRVSRPRTQWNSAFNLCKLDFQTPPALLVSAPAQIPSSRSSRWALFLPQTRVCSSLMPGYGTNW